MNGMWKSVALAMITIVFMAFVQWITLGFSVPSRSEMQVALEKTTSANDKRLTDIVSKVDSLQGDISDIKAQISRLNALLEVEMRERRRER